MRYKLCLTFGSRLAASSAVLTVRYNAAGGLPAVLKSPAAQLSLLSSTWLRWYVRAGNMPLPESLRNRSGLDVQAMMLQACEMVGGWVGGLGTTSRHAVCGASGDSRIKANILCRSCLCCICEWIMVQLVNQNSAKELVYNAFSTTASHDSAPAWVAGHIQVVCAPTDIVESSTCHLGLMIEPSIVAVYHL